MFMDWKTEVNLPQIDLQVQCCFIKVLLWIFFVDVGKLSYNLHRKFYIYINSWTILKKNKVGRTTHYKATVIKTMVLAKGQPHRSMAQNRMSLNRPTHGQLIFDKGTEAIQWWKDSLCNKWCWNNWQFKCIKINLDLKLASYTKVNSK